jgi:hypothetical protein
MKQLIHMDNQFNEIIYLKWYVKKNFNVEWWKVFHGQQIQYRNISAFSDLTWSFKFNLFCHFLVKMLQLKGVIQREESATCGYGKGYNNCEHSSVIKCEIHEILERKKYKFIHWKQLLLQHQLQKPVPQLHF